MPHCPTLPKELWGIIIGGLPLSDKIRMEVICSTWRAIIEQSYTPTIMWPRGNGWHIFQFRCQKSMLFDEIGWKFYERIDMG